jgi:hypothetical protein
MYEEVTAERALKDARINPLTAIGMNELHPDGRQQFRNMPTPRIRLQMP